MSWEITFDAIYLLGQLHKIQRESLSPPYIYICMRVHIHTHTHIYIYMYIYIQ